MTASTVLAPTRRQVPQRVRTAERQGQHRQTDSNRVDTPLQNHTGDVHLTVFIGKNRDSPFEVTDPAAEFEFFVLRF